MGGGGREPLQQTANRQSIKAPDSTLYRLERKGGRWGGRGDVCGRVEVGGVFQDLWEVGGVIHSRWRQGAPTPSSNGYAVGGGDSGGDSGGEDREAGRGIHGSWRSESPTTSAGCGVRRVQGLVLCYGTS